MGGGYYFSLWVNECPARQQGFNTKEGHWRNIAVGWSAIRKLELVPGLIPSAGLHAVPAVAVQLNQLRVNRFGKFRCGERAHEGVQPAQNHENWAPTPAAADCEPRMAEQHRCATAIAVVCQFRFELLPFLPPRDCRDDPLPRRMLL